MSRACSNWTTVASDPKEAGTIRRSDDFRGVASSEEARESYKGAASERILREEKEGYRRSEKTDR